MQSLIQKVTDKQKKTAVVDIHSGDNVRVHQKIVEGGKERIQIFEGLVIRISRKNSLSGSFTVRRIASGVGVEKMYLIHSPNVLKIEITKRSKVRRNYLTYMRSLTGKRARLTGVDFDRKLVNEIADDRAEEEEAKIKEEQIEGYDPEAAKAEKAAQKAETAAAVNEPKPEAEKLEEKPAAKASSKSPAQTPNKQSK